MRRVPKRAAECSAQDLLRFQSEGGVELVNGQIVEKGASIGSCQVQTTLIGLLAGEAASSAMAAVFTPSMGYQCFPDEPSRYRKPDVSLVRSERLSRMKLDAKLIPFPPDLAIEVVPPTETSYQLNERIEEYLKSGFTLIWVVYPNTRMVSVYRSDRSVSVLREQDEITGEAALPSFRCKVNKFFAA